MKLTQRNFIHRALTGSFAITALLTTSFTGHDHRDEAAANDWTVVSMKDDWKTIFPPEKK